MPSQNWALWERWTSTLLNNFGKNSVSFCCSGSDSEVSRVGLSGYTNDDGDAGVISRAAIFPVQ